MDLDINAKRLIIESKRELRIKIFCIILALATFALLVGSSVSAKATAKEKAETSVTEQLEALETDEN